MSAIPDFTPEETKVVQDTLKERYGKPIEAQAVDVELRLTPNDGQVTECPAMYWENEDCHFILAKTGDSSFYSQFFYGGREQFGTGRQSYNDILDCLVTTLRVQADHELERNKVKDLNK
jgi:hypothetical protein